MVEDNNKSVEEPPMRKMLLAIAAAAIFAAPSAAMAQAPIVIKFSHVVAPNTPKGKGSEKFKELADLQGQGRTRGAAARRRPDAGTVELEVRPDRHQGL